MSGKKSSWELLNQVVVLMWQMKTTARKDEIMGPNGQDFITGGMSFLVNGARTGKEGLGGISLFLLRQIHRALRSSIDKKMGWWSSDTATLYFDNFRIPPDNLMGGKIKDFLPS